MSKRLAITVAGIAAISLLAGCAVGGEDAGSSEEGNVTLTLLTFETPNLDAAYWDAAIAATNEVVPGVTIEKLVAPNADRNAYAAQLDSTGQLPDIMVAVDPNAFAPAGKLAEFDPDDLADWINPMSNSFDGKIFQLASNSQTFPIYYNRASFEAAGIDGPPATWAELLDASAKLKAAGITPFNIGGGGADTWANIYLLTALVGTEVYAKDPDWLAKLNAGEVAFSDSQFTAAVEKFKELIDLGYIDPALTSNDYATAQASFLEGTGAMYPMGSWFTVAPSTDQQEDFGVFALPTDDGSLVVPTYTGGGLSVSASAPDVELAQKWAIAFSQSEQNNDAGVKNDGLFVSIKSYTPKDELQTPLYASTYEGYQEAVSSGIVTAAFSLEGGTTSLLPGFSAEVNSAIADLINGRKDVAAFTAYLDEKWASLSQ